MVALIAAIPDSQLTGTGYYAETYRYSRSRLHTVNDHDGRDAWVTDEDRVGEYIQADFGQLKRIQSVATQGRASQNQWVSTYKFAYSTDGVTYDYVTSDDGSDRVFVGNRDRSTVVENSFDVFVARFVRLYPLTDNDHMALRWEVYGCSYSG